MSQLQDVLAQQSGVVSRAQLRELSVSESEIRRLLRRRDLVAVTPGVYVDHTGPPTWVQEAWAALLAVWPAALSHDSALRAADGPGRRPGVAAPCTSRSIDTARPRHLRGSGSTGSRTSTPRCCGT